jgi:hypothetical protein
MITMSVSIRQGYSVSSKEPERVKELRKLESFRVLDLKKEEWQTCRKCHTPNLVDENFRREKSSTCTNCGKIIHYSKNAVSHYTVSRINHKNIVKICGQELTKAFGESNCTYNKDQRTWVCSYKNRKVPVFISRISSFNQYFSEGPESSWLCVLTDWEKEHGIINYYNQLHFIRFEDILYDKIKLDEMIAGVATEFAPNPTVELDHKFDSFVSSSSPADFEKEFVDQFINGIREKANVLKAFFSFLSARKNTIVNSKVILMGGPANPDFATINLLEYLQEGLKPDKIGEAKRYFRSTQFTVEDFGKAQAHALGSDTVSVISTNKIQPEVWRLIIENRNKEKYYKHVVIEKDTMLLLISVLKMDYLLSR